ncbi:family 16 glycosylhydrolase [Brevibacterium otitidis]|uniref:family 16 glycosylhydrolase n=1 Tax=Brevibacterium otitidis TaxID=53364 RepID=UPI00363322C6
MTVIRPSAHRARTALALLFTIVLVFASSVGTAPPAWSQESGDPTSDGLGAGAQATLTPKGPTFDDNNQTVYIPSDYGIRYYIDVDGTNVTKDGLPYAKPGTYTKDDGIRTGVPITVTAKPVNPKDELDGQTEWETTLPDRPTLTPKGPTFDDNNQTVYIPSDYGIRYYIDVDGTNVTKDGLPYAKPGTYTKDDGIRTGVPITVTAKPVNPKDVLDGQTEWKTTLPDRPKLTPKGPTFNDWDSTVYIPSDRGIRYYIDVDGTNVTKDGLPYAKPGLYTKDDGIRTGVPIKVTAKPANPKDELDGDTEWTHTLQKRPDSSLASGDEFDDSATLPNEGWKVLDTSYKKDLPEKVNTIYTRDSVSVKDGSLEIRTARHCLDKDQKPSAETESPDGAVCPAGKKTMYTSGRIETDYIYNAPFEMEIRARMSDGKIDGMHFAGWLLNNQPYCTSPEVQKSDLGEIDTMEVLSQHAHTTNTTHVTCVNTNGRGAGTKRDAHQLDGQIAGVWNTYRMTWDGDAVRYYFNDQLVPSSRGQTPETRGETVGLSDDDFRRALMDYPFKAIIDSVVFPDDYTWVRPVDDSKPFPARVDRVDYFRMKQLDDIYPGGAIGSYWKNNKWLGAPLSGEEDAGPDGARMQKFEKGVVYWSRTTGAHGVKGGIKSTYDREKGADGWLGLPRGEERKLAHGGASQTFEGGQIHWSRATGAHPTKGAIQKYWASQKWENGWLGYPIGGEIRNKDGSVRQNFQGGTVYWSAKTGAHGVKGTIRSTYHNLKGADGWLGLPRSDERRLRRDGGAYQVFEHGQIHWSRKSGAHPTKGAIQKYWASQKWENGWLGYPTSGEIRNKDGSVYQNFQHGRVTWKSGRGITVKRF